MKQLLSNKLLKGEITRSQFLQLLHIAGEIRLPTVIRTRRISQSKLERLNDLGYTVIIHGGAM